jgi:hypothetical protein
MKLAFDLRACGLGNNGGSRTIILSNKELRNLGHESYIICNPKHNHFTWFNFNYLLNDPPKDLNALIATHCKTVMPVINSGVNTKAWYIRLHETQSMREKELINLYSKKNLIKIVNSIGLKNKLSSFGIDNVHVVYQGIDIQDWADFKSRGDKLRIGCLYSVSPRKNWVEFKELANLLGGKDYEFVAFGASRCKDGFLNAFLLNPDHKYLLDLYNSCHIWFAPTKQEGLHNVPMEAALCGCLIVCGNYEENGMLGDYAFDNVTSHVYTNLEDAVNKIKNPSWDLVSNMKNYLTNNIGNRTKNMETFVKVLNNNVK